MTPRESPVIPEKKNPVKVYGGPKPKVSGKLLQGISHHEDKIVFSL